MIRGYYIGATDPVIEYPWPEEWNGESDQREEDDIEMTAQSGRTYVDKLSSRRVFNLKFIIPESILTFFREQHDAVGGRESAFYFVLDVAGSPIESFLVRKEKEFRHRFLAAAMHEGEMVRWYELLQTLTEDKDNEYSIEA